MNKKKYVAYVGTYVHGSSKGLNVYDVDVENGILTPRNEVEVSEFFLCVSVPEFKISVFHRR